MTTATIDLQSDIAAVRAARPDATDLEILATLQSEWDSYLSPGEYVVLTHKAVELLSGQHDCALHAQLINGEFLCAACGQSV